MPFDASTIIRDSNALIPPKRVRDPFKGEINAPHEDQTVIMNAIAAKLTAQRSNVETRLAMARAQAQKNSPLKFAP